MVTSSCPAYCVRGCRETSIDGEVSNSRSVHMVPNQLMNSSFQCRDCHRIICMDFFTNFPHVEHFQTCIRFVGTTLRGEHFLHMGGFAVLRGGGGSPSGGGGGIFQAGEGISGGGFLKGDPEISFFENCLNSLRLITLPA